MLIALLATLTLVVARDDDVSAGHGGSGLRARAAARALTVPAIPGGAAGPSTRTDAGVAAVDRGEG